MKRLGAHWRKAVGTAREVPGQLGHPNTLKVVLFSLGALAALGVGSAMGNLRSPFVHDKVIAGIAAAAFVVFGSLAVRTAAGELHRLVSWKASESAGVAVRISAIVLGAILVLFVTLGMLDISVSHLLLGGAITGVIVGIAAQQSLGNVFAGIVLLVVRPFGPGDLVRVRSGAMGGEMVGTVTDIGLTYVSLRTEQGLLRLPNSGVLAAAVGVVEQLAAPSGQAKAAPSKSLDARSALVAGRASRHREPDERPLPLRRSRRARPSRQADIS